MISFLNMKIKMFQPIIRTPESHSYWFSLEFLYMIVSSLRQYKQKNWSNMKSSWYFPASLFPSFVFLYFARFQFNHRVYARTLKVNCSSLYRTKKNIDNKWLRTRLEITLCVTNFFYIILYCFQYYSLKMSFK